MSIKSLVEISIDSIKNYKTLIDNHKGSRDYGNDIVSSYNFVGENIEALSEEIEDIFSDDKRYSEHFESDDIQDFLSEQLNLAYDEYEKLKNQKKCEEKIALAYEWFFEVMLFTTDDEEIKSKITLNSNNITLIPNTRENNFDIKEKSKVLIKISDYGKTEEMYLVVEEVVDDYLYSYLGDKDNEEDLIIFHKENVFKVR